MKLTKQDFFEALKRLGPHAVMEFVLTPLDEIFQYLNSEIELDKVEGTQPVQFDVAEHNVVVRAKKLHGNHVYVEIVKKPEGFLGHY